ncbi:MAG TPA: sarcosine oxidase subunit alpha family protein [Rhodopila sp.]|uniref:sarcosine oxidase subunit alpha family protein n=1 Tax=Rhodopila sp. TaxID=2480087 RepID=UPI002BD90455|nr:sarcosine oxidase subunit alpha family protein [Rhodopila sp.]HVY16931.1 sarcosine oxidase subunit alpha family protein [Rhodopila sp.]
MTQPFRMPAGGRIDRNRPLRFRFDGRLYDGFAGDTLASALLANDVAVVGRSFKYHRPRGIVAAGAEEPNALVTLDEGARGVPGRVTPNLRATQMELYDGLTARSQNRFPSLRFDLGSLAGLAAPLLGAGFYYKSFMWPQGFWRRLYEPAIRRAAGLGKAPRAADPDWYVQQYAHCEVLIVGAGPAGLAAALAAARTGARVILCDEQAEPGGYLLSAPDVAIDGMAAPDWVAQTLERIADNVLVVPRTTAFGWFPGNLIGLAQRLDPASPGVRPDSRASTPADPYALGVEPPPVAPPRERLWHVRAERVILATGAIERPLVFPGNDRPGVMLASAALTYLHRYGVKPGQRAVIATADDSAYLTAIALHRAGLPIAAIADLRERPFGEAVDLARDLDIPVHAGAAVIGTEGRMRVHTVRLGTGQAVPCDTVLVSGGWTPTVHLASQARQPLRFDAASGTFLPLENAVGSAAGTFDLAACLRDGAAAGGLAAEFVVDGLPATAPSGPPLPAAPHAKAFVDLQNDVTTKDLYIAATEGFVSVEHLKRYTTTGMATDQGKTSNLNAVSTLAALTGQPMDAVGLTTFRPPYTPVTFGALAGAARDALYAPIRLPPIVQAGAVTEDVGQWKRARCFPRNGETIAAAVARERQAVRNDVGIFDASTLGKIEVTGPDAALFLEKIYTGAFAGLLPGRCRYAMLLGEDGFIRDDGIVARLALDRFHVTTTTGGAGFVLHHMEDYLQTEFTTLRAWLTSVTEQHAVIAVQGPRSAALLAPFIRGVDLGTLPHMSVREAHFDSIPIRLFRAGFTGEAGFEINLPPPDAQRVWDTLREAGATPYGTDAMHVLRAEKGYIVVGQETDGTVTPDDVGLAWMIPKGKRDFVGMRSLRQSDLKRADRKQLVGLKAEATLEEGAQITEPGGGFPLGHVTSAYPGIALALLQGGRARVGEALQVRRGKEAIPVTVVAPIVYDKPGERLRPTPVPVTDPLSVRPAETRVPPVPVSTADVGMVALAPATLLSLRAGAAAAGIGMALGVLLPTVPCRSVITERAALWLGPDEWLIQAPEPAEGLIALVRKGAGDHPISVVDVSHRTLALEIAGPLADWCINGFCALDLDLRVFPVGTCTRTVLGKAEIMLWRIAPEVFHVHAPRSFFPYVWACLRQAALSLGGDARLTPEGTAG